MIEGITASQKARLHEVADGLLKVYHTLVRMQFLPASWIEEGPHDMTAFLPVYEELGLDPSIIYLYSILPYVKSPDGRADFLQGGEFIDFRDEDEIRQGRDPMYAGDDENNLRPWMTPLSGISNHYSAIIYDARQHAIGIFGQMDSGGSRDHNIDEGWTPMEVTQGEVNERNGNDSEGRGGVSNDSGSDEDEDEDWEDEDEDEDEDMDGECHWDEMRCRPAPNVLRDMVLWFENLTELPGGGEHSDGEWSKSIIKPLYLKHGWPSADFDGDAFLVDQARALAALLTKWDAEEPLRQVRELQVTWQEDPPWVQQKRKAVAKARRLDDEWFARWELFVAEEGNAAIPRRLREAEARAERLCPGGQAQKPEELPLWELKELRRVLKAEDYRLARYQDQVKEAAGAGGPGGVSVDLRNNVERSEKKLRTLQQAIKASEADAERMCPGKSLPISPDIAEPEGQDDEIWIKAIQQWLTLVPPRAYRARAAAEKRLEEHQAYLQQAIQEVNQDLGGGVV